MAEQNRVEQASGPSLRDAVVTFAAVVLAFAAFDDITTDPAPSFTLEWLGLGVCAVWLLFVSWWLVRCGHQWLGLVSVVALAVGVAASFRIKPGMDPLSVEYLATLAVLVWFVGLSGMLATRTWWERPHTTV